MLRTERDAARAMRKKGLSLKEITKTLGVAKSSVSVWVRDVVLTQPQKNALAGRRVSREVVERRRATRLFNENVKRQIILDAAEKEIKKLQQGDLWIIGAMLYWAEGGKTVRGLVRFSNSDPKMIILMMKFFRRVCKVKEERFRGSLHIHPHLDSKNAERYWSELTRIPLRQFFQTYNKMNVSSKQKMDSLPMGTFDIYICDTQLFLRIQGWIKGIAKAFP